MPSRFQTLTLSPQRTAWPCLAGQMRRRSRMSTLRLLIIAVLLVALAGALLFALRGGRFGNDQQARLTDQFGQHHPATLSDASLTSVPPPVPPARARINAAFGKLPLYFVENRGQTDARVGYYVQGHDKTIYFTNQGLTFVLNGPAEREQEAVLQPASFRPAAPTAPPQRWALKLDFVGARAGARPEGEAPTEAVFSYFKGHHSQWQTGLKSYARIVYRELWPGIDLVYAGTVNRMKYSFVVRPGADPNQIKLAYRGASAVKLNVQGELEVQTPVGGFTDERPVSYQEQDGQQVEIATAYQIEGDGKTSATNYGFQVGAYDRSRELVIDPAVLVYAGFIGGSNYDTGGGITVDSAGNAYVTGATNSDETSFPDGDGFGALTRLNPSATDGGAFVAKINAAGTALLYAGYIGGAGGSAIAVDSVGNAYITGTAGSTVGSFPDGDGFGTLNSPDTTFNGISDAFVAKINAAGTALLYAGYIGGSDEDNGYGIAVDSAGNAYVTGRTVSEEDSFPDGDGFDALMGLDTTFNSSVGVPDAFVVKVNATGTALVYATYIGGSIGDVGNDIAVDSAGNAYITGVAGSDENSFPDGDGFGTLTGPDTTHNVGGDAFVAKINAAGTAFVYVGYIGGYGYDTGYGIALDSTGNAYITGSTSATEATFPDGDGFGTLPGPDATFNSPSFFYGDAFVAKVNAAGTALVYAGYIGGDDEDAGHDIAVDSAGNAYVTGLTNSTEAGFPDGDGFGALTGPDTTFNGGGVFDDFNRLVGDAFVAKINATGTALVYAGYIGGSGDDYGTGIAVDGAGNAYVIGTTRSTEATFPDGDGFGALTGPDTTYNGSINDAFVAKIRDYAATLSKTSQSFAANGGADSFNVTIDPGGPWTATTSSPFITITAPTGLTTGSGTVSYTITSHNGASPRNGTISVAGQTFTVWQGAAFLDVPPGHAFYTEIGKLSARGITLGCGDGNFCPDQSVTREQMAALLSRALGIFSPPPPSAQRFADVPPTHLFYAFIEEIAVRQITLGCGGGNYCPTNNVTREQMAAFLIRALHEPGYTPPPPPTQRFLDVAPSHLFYAHIEELALRGITLGCGGGNYCPTDFATRAQMAAFLVRALAL